MFLKNHVRSSLALLVGSASNYARVKTGCVFEYPVSLFLKEDQGSGLCYATRLFYPICRVLPGIDFRMSAFAKEMSDKDD